jgi:hypothetical protein
MSNATPPTTKSGESDDAVETEPSVSSARTQEHVERELSYEEFDPKGTLTLILIYMGILGVMWVFMYFFEFLGNELVVIG